MDGGKTVAVLFMKCKRCEVEKHVEEFHRDRGFKSGRNSTCMACKKMEKDILSSDLEKGPDLYAKGWNMAIRCTFDELSRGLSKKMKRVGISDSDRNEIRRWINDKRSEMLPKEKDE